MLFVPNLKQYRKTEGKGAPKILFLRAEDLGPMLAVSLVSPRFFCVAWTCILRSVFQNHTRLYPGIPDLAL